MRKITNLLAMGTVLLGGLSMATSADAIPPPTYQHCCGQGDFQCCSFNGCKMTTEGCESY